MPPSDVSLISGKYFPIIILLVIQLQGYEPCNVKIKKYFFAIVFQVVVAKKV